MDKTLVIQTNDSCNLACKYCYEKNKSTHVMTFETAKKAIDVLFPTLKDGNVILHFIGGEPLLQIDLIDQITDYFSTLKDNFHIIIATNGTLCNTDSFIKYKEKWKDKLTYKVSVDGNKEMHNMCRVFKDGTGSFDIAIKEAKKELEENPDTHATMVITPQNIKYLYDSVKYDIDLGYKTVVITYNYDEYWNNESAKQLYREFKKIADYILDKQVNISLFNEYFCHPREENVSPKWCKMGQGSLITVDCSGDIYPCIRMTPSSIKNREPYKIGDLENGINNEDRIKEYLSDECILPERCYSCPIGLGCSYCGAVNYRETGNVNKVVKNTCWPHRARALYNCYYWNKYYKKNNIEKVWKLDLDRETSLKIVDKEEYALLLELQK